MRKWALVVSHQGVLLLAFILLLSGCTTSGTGPHTTPIPTQAATSTPLPILTPVTGLLDPLPSDCQPVPPPATLTYEQFGGGFIGTVTLHGGGQA